MEEPTPEKKDEKFIFFELWIHLIDGSIEMNHIKLAESEYFKFKDSLILSYEKSSEKDVISLLGSLNNGYDLLVIPAKNIFYFKLVALEKNPREKEEGISPSP